MFLIKLFTTITLFTMALTLASAFRYKGSSSFKPSSSGSKRFRGSSPFRSSHGFKKFRKRSKLTPSSSYKKANPFEGCTGSAKYNVTFLNMLTTRRMGSLIPATGLNFSPLTVAAHSNRFSLFAIRSYAPPFVEDIAERGDNRALLQVLEASRRDNNGIKSFGSSPGMTLPGNYVSIVVEVDCMHPFITGLSMITPSPDWIVQINNLNMYSRKGGKFRSHRYGYMLAYDAGTDNGGDFTDPADASLDLPTVPQKNIAPLVEDETDRFDGRIVGKFTIKKM